MKTRLNSILTFAFALLFFASPNTVRAHKLNTSYTTLIAEGDALKVRVRMDDFDLLKIGIDQNGDSLLFYEEMVAGLDDIFAFVEEQMRLRANGQPLTLVRDRGDITPDNKGNMFANVYFSAELEEPVNELEVWVGWPERFGEAHKNLAKIMLTGQPLVQAVFSAESPQQTFAGEKSLWDHLYEFTVLGVEHIFLGYDHVMFLLALIVVGGRLLILVKVVTAFTVAHSITLCLAALEIVRLPSQWIEAGIALSIVYVAVENFWLKRMEYRWIITFAFGLVHGFGFANVLRELGLPTRGLVASLFAFNAGVEIGQVAIVALVFPLIAWLSRQSYQRTVVLVVSAFIGFFGLGWFVERVFGLEYMPF